MYEKHCEWLTTIGKEYAARVYGIQRNAALNRLTYFHVVDALPPDVMYDLLEGAVNCEVKSHVNHLHIWEDFDTGPAEQLYEIF